MEFADLHDLGFSGNAFTWSNGRKGEEGVKERLDRVLANESWKSLHKMAAVTHEVTSYSDHNPIFLSLMDNKRLRVNRNGKKRKSRFETFWMQDEECAEILDKN